MDSKIEAGGGMRIELGLVRRVPNAVVCAHMASSVPGESGHAPPEKTGNVDHVRVLLRPSEATITTQKFMASGVCNSGNSSYSHFSEPLPFGTSLLFEALPQNCLLGAAVFSALCLQDMKQ